MEQLVVTSFRLPRIVLAILAGAALAVSGRFYKGLFVIPGLPGYYWHCRRCFCGSGHVLCPFQ
ncbi:iron chelate uptake ABC transporter family permease subunit [Caldalkalibacillus thermarum]|uniref:iron chelate uptake ABC transporter family permease subunit n=1 Tax=Caldalkalibacillus thermarum TaxID=296745 RepID=UPI0023EB9DBC|nr:iron chelate uptake ABC transporter family permease subunit [Caldalkalibacillus thermarum]